MKLSRFNPLLLFVAVLLAIGAYSCTLGVMVRTDDAGELASKRLDAVLLALLWPFAFALLGLALGIGLRRVMLWAIAVLFVAWMVGAGSMQKEYSRNRDGNFWGYAGF